jgi:hypothetical protein
MLANLQQTVSLWLTEKTGITAGFLAFGATAVIATLICFIFLCVSGYAWAAAALGPVFGGLALAGGCLAIAACCLAVALTSRNRAQHRAVLERARRSQGTSSLINPKTLQVVIQAGRHVGWPRLIPIALVAFLATHFARQYRRPTYNSDRDPT